MNVVDITDSQRQPQNRLHRSRIGVGATHDEVVKKPGNRDFLNRYFVFHVGRVGDVGAEESRPIGVVHHRFA